jgi:hypothetical protein
MNIQSILNTSTTWGPEADKLNANFTELEAKADALETTTTELEAKADALETTTTELEAQIDALQAASGGGGTTFNILAIRPQYYERDYVPRIKGALVAAYRITLQVPKLATNLGSVLLPFEEQEIVLSNAAAWDTTAGTNYTVAANRAGVNFYLYATANGLLLSANATVPSGYTAETSKQVGGFHCLCLSVGNISGHPLSGFLTGDILPASVWDLAHRPICSPAGMVYSALADIWVDIYLQSGTGAATRSAFGGTITDTRDWMDFTDDLGAVGKRMLSDPEFHIAAAGGNEKTNIVGSADPVTTGGHVDTAGRRMINNVGCEDMTGALWQWLLDQSYMNGTTYVGSWNWLLLNGNKGSIYRTGTSPSSGDAKLRGGGDWAAGGYCGSRARDISGPRWGLDSHTSSRGCARHRG